MRWEIVWGTNCLGYKLSGILYKLSGFKLSGVPVVWSTNCLGYELSGVGYKLSGVQIVWVKIVQVWVALGGIVWLGIMVGEGEREMHTLECLVL